MPNPYESPARPKHRWFQFSLRTWFALCVIAGLAIACGFERWRNGELSAENRRLDEVNKAMVEELAEYQEAEHRVIANSHSDNPFAAPER